jgi:hypothetical protein
MDPVDLLARWGLLPPDVRVLTGGEHAIGVLAQG